MEEDTRAEAEEPSEGRSRLRPRLRTQAKRARRTRRSARRPRRRTGDNVEEEPEEREEPQEPVESDNKPEERENEFQAVSSSDGEEKREYQKHSRRKCAPESEGETDDEDAKHQELVPEDSKCQEEKPEAYVVHSSPDSGTTEPAPDVEDQCKSHYERAHSQWVLEGRSSLPYV